MRSTRSLQLQLFMLLVCFNSLQLHADTTFRSAELQRLAGVLHICADSLHEGTNNFRVSGRSVKLRCQQGRVQTIGYHLFTDEMKSAVGTPILDFLERYFLQLDYPHADRPSSRMALEDRFRFLSGTQAVVGTIRPGDDFALDHEHHQYTATWRRNGKKILSVQFPANHELISGETKVESEQNMEADIQMAAGKSIETISASQLSATSQSAYFVRRGNTYCNNLFASNLYYQRQDSSFVLVSDANHPLETAANMLLCHSFHPDHKLVVEQTLYGFKKKRFETSLSQWIAYCKNNGCKLYYGIETYNEQRIKATVIAVNEAENFNHVLQTEIPMTALADSTVPVSAVLSAFVPMHNVRHLFGQYKSSNKKQKHYQ